VACIRKRRGKWVVDYRDSAGIRRWVTCGTRREAEDVYDDKHRETRQATRPVVDPDITVAAYAERWLGLVAASAKPRTLTMYRGYLRRHLLPVFGTTKVRRLPKGRIRGFLAEQLRAGLPTKAGRRHVVGAVAGEQESPRREGYSRHSVQLMLAVLHGMLNAAIDDGVILANPAARLGRQLRLHRPPIARQDAIKAMTREQLEHFLAVAARVVPRLATLFLLFGRTGLRLSEALALQWPDLNFAARELRVARALGPGGHLDTPKSGGGRTVDLSQALTQALRRLEVARKAEALRRGWPGLPPWVFCDPSGRLLRPQVAEAAMQRVLKAAGLPRHFTPHCLRHTFASLLLQQGESPVYVQRQLGHASITLTVDTYGRWLPMGNKAAVDRLDGPSGSKTVATVAGGALEKHGESWGSGAGADRRSIISP
jgi:integrase